MLCHVTITNLPVLYNQKTGMPVLSHLCLCICEMGKDVIFRVYLPVQQHSVGRNCGVFV